MYKLLAVLWGKPVTLNTRQFSGETAVNWHPTNTSSHLLMQNRLTFYLTCFTVQLLGHLLWVAKEVAEQENLEKSGYRLGEDCSSLSFLFCLHSCIG